MRNLLPIGSVIEIRNTENNKEDDITQNYYIIIGKRRSEKDEYDYTCVKYPYGFVGELYYHNDSDVNYIVNLGNINY